MCVCVCVRAIRKVVPREILCVISIHRLVPFGGTVCNRESIPNTKDACLVILGPIVVHFFVGIRAAPQAGRRPSRRGKLATSKGDKYQKNPRVRKIRVRNSGAGNGCANFMDTWKKYVLSAGKTMSVKFPFFGVFFLGGGGSADFIFMGARIFLKVLKRGQQTPEKQGNHFETPTPTYKAKL